MTTYNTYRQNHILLMLADGSTLQEMSEELEVSVNTIKHDIAAMKLMYNAKNLPNLVAIAFQANILKPYKRMAT